ncbi:Hsp70 protein [Frankia sp. EI5c]|uniref:Hsp70 family protein n=1 Tax=Frankia sp. EI5c TaxID=683316 RepID=UPI0007C3281C|nr:Hsp70 family protein [Frankia sp. EI5c]OAA29214.1 Hsp70 protein [Frankia sp. EI5c]
MSYGLGVDLGTTFTAVATGRPDRLEMVSLGSRSTAVPSVAYAASEGGLLTGDAAERRAGQEPARAAREFKRRLGDPTPIVLAGVPYSPAALLAATLRDAVAAAVRLEGEPPDRVVLSRPAVWGAYRLEQFEDVPRLAGLSEVHLVTEPVAAGTYYATARQLADGDVIAVYDLGGGTFDSAVLRCEAGAPRLLGTPEGVEWLGGVDFDAAVLRHVDEELGGAVTAADPHEDAVALTRLRHECVLAKEALTFDAETVIPVFLTGAHRQVRLTRERFEELAAPAVAATVDGLRRALESAEVAPADLTAVLLSGGSSRIPLVARTLAAQFGRPVLVDAHPKHVVALGAAQIAATLLAAGTGTGTAADTDTAADPAPAVPPPPGPPPPPDMPDRTVAGRAKRRRVRRATAQEDPVATAASGAATEAAGETEAAAVAPTGHELATAASGNSDPGDSGPGKGESPVAGEARSSHWRRLRPRRRPAAARPDDQPSPDGAGQVGLSRRDVTVALVISLVALVLAAVAGAVYGYATRTKAPSAEPTPRAASATVLADVHPATELVRWRGADGNRG